MKILHLSLHAHWFALIAAGVKREEYRAATAYWTRRLCRETFDAVLFVNGYGKHRPAILVQCLGHSLDRGNPCWGGLDNDLQWVIQLGTILEMRNMNQLTRTRP